MYSSLNRFQSAKGVFPIFSTIALFFLLSAVSANAEPLVITKPSFTISFQNGYSASPFLPSTDSSFLVMDTTAGEAFVSGQTFHSATPVHAGIYLSALNQAAIGQMSRTDSITKTLGGNVFSSVGYKEEVGQDADTTTRIRIYVTTKGNLVLFAYLIYKSVDGSASVARFEEALKTLTLNSSATIRKSIFSQSIQRNALRYDLKGRVVYPLTQKIATSHFSTQPK